MKTITEIRDWLAAHKGSGVWERVAQGAGIPYNSLARIARGVVKSPRIDTAERLCEGIAQFERRAKAKNRG